MGQKVRLSMNEGNPCVGDLVEEYAKKRGYNVEQCTFLLAKVFLTTRIDKKDFRVFWVPLLNELCSVPKLGK